MAGPGRGGGAMSSQKTSSSQQTKRAGENTLITSIFTPGSDSLKSESCDVHVNGKAPAPVPTLAQPLETSAYHPPWRKQSVYGRADLDAITAESWDNGNGTRSDDLQESKAGSIQSKDSASLSPSSYSNHKRRIRDEEAQWKVQDALRYKYQGIDEE